MVPVINNFYFDFSIVQEETDCPLISKTSLPAQANHIPIQAKTTHSEMQKKKTKGNKLSIGQVCFKGKLNTKQKHAQFHNYEEGIEENTE